MSVPGFFLVNAGLYGQLQTYNEFATSKFYTYSGLNHSPSGHYAGAVWAQINFHPIDGEVHNYRFTCSIWCDTQGEVYPEGYPNASWMAIDRWYGYWIAYNSTVLNLGNLYTYENVFSYKSKSWIHGGTYDWCAEAGIIWSGYYGRWGRTGGNFILTVGVESLEDDPVPDKNVLQMLIEQN